MNVSKLPLLGALAALSTFVSMLPVSAQGYHYGYGSSRVVNQNNIGLHNHDSTYIGAGTMSDSARGIQRGGYRPNPLLPQVNLGRNVKTAGDNFYQGGAPVLYDRSLYVPRRKVTKRKVQKKQKQGTYYVPGQNAGASGVTNSNGTYKYSSGGALTYGESDSLKNNTNNNNNGGYSNNSAPYNYSR